MKIDKNWRDSKGRYWVFYISIDKNIFISEISIAGHGFLFSYTHYSKKIKEDVRK